MPRITNPQERHNALVGGIPIWPRTGTGVRGTLTAVARRNTPNRERVLVTCAHVVSIGSPTLYHIHDEGHGEVMYHGGTSETDKIGELYVDRDANNAIVFRSWSVIQAGRTSNPPDVAALRILNNASTDLGVHLPNDDDDNHTHEFRPIVAPSVEPLEGMSVIRLGSTTGQRTVPISNTSPESTAFLEEPSANRVYYFFPASDYFELNHLGPGGDQGNYSKKGDSGAPLLWEDGDGNLRLVGIHFDSVAQFGKAIPALLAESLLQVRFGVKAPTAEAEYRVGNVVRPQVVHSGETVTLDGSSSEVKEPEASPLTYQWEQVLPEPDVGTPNVTITNRTQHIASFTAPPGNNTLEFKLTVTDSNGAKAADSVTVNVVNIPPTANAGDDKTAYRGETVELNGSGNDANEDTLTYQWEQLGLDELGVVPVTPVTITNADQANASFVAPNQIGALSFKLTVTDSHGASHSDTVTVTVQNRSPIAHAGPNRVINANNPVTLEGSVSDPDPIDRNYVASNTTRGLRTAGQKPSPLTPSLTNLSIGPSLRTWLVSISSP